METGRRLGFVDFRRCKDEKQNKDRPSVSSVICEDETETLGSERLCNTPNELSSSALALHSLPRHGRLQSRLERAACGREEDKVPGWRETALARSLQSHGKSLLSPLCRKHFLQHTAFLRWCPSLTSVLLMCLLEISRTGFLFICVLCKQLLQASGGEQQGCI